MITSNYVDDETATRLRYDGGLEAALRFRDLLRESASADRLRVIWVDERIEAEAWEILEHYAALTFSLTDATSAAVARRWRLSEFFGLDHHFEALRFAVLPGNDCCG